MNLWGIKVSESNPARVTVPIDHTLVITRAALASTSNDPVILSYVVDEQTIVLGTLRYEKCEQFPLDICVAPDATLFFKTKGKGDVHVSGYFNAASLSDDEYPDYFDSDEDDDAMAEYDSADDSDEDVPRVEEVQEEIAKPATQNQKQGTRLGGPQAKQAQAKTETKPQPEVKKTEPKKPEQKAQPEAGKPEQKGQPEQGKPEQKKPEPKAQQKSPQQKGPQQKGAQQKTPAQKTPPPKTQPQKAPQTNTTDQKVQEKPQEQKAPVENKEQNKPQQKNADPKNAQKREREANNKERPAKKAKGAAGSITCPNCPKTFTSQQAMASHQKDKHNAK